MTDKIPTIKTLMEQVLNKSLASDESTVKQSYKIEVDEAVGFYFIPRLPSSLIMDATLYYRIYDILAFALFPAYTLIRASSMQLVTRPGEPLTSARAFFYPWKQGQSKRLVGSRTEILQVDHNRIRLMSGIDYDFNKAVHVAITGNTGSGKSTALRYFLELYSRLGKVVLIDPKISDGSRWARNKPNIQLTIPNSNDRPEDFLPRVNETLATAIQELNQRQRLLFERSDSISTDYRELGVQPIFIVIDEVASLSVGLKKSFLDEFHALLTQIALLGREAGVFLTLSLQEARADLLPVPVRSQMGVRILLGRIDKNTAQFLFPELESGYPLPIGGKGTGIVSINDGEHFGIEPISMPTITESETTHD